MPPVARLPRTNPALRRCPPWAALLALVLALLVAPTAPAGAADFDAAVSVWLNGDEGEALADLAGLAQDGDLRARLLLGLIDKTPALQGPWLARLPREQRMALLRAPGGLSGRSWLAEAEELPLAVAWQELMQVGAGLDVAARFAAMGEARAARQAVSMMAAREELTPGEDWPDWLDPELAWLVWPVAGEGLRERIRDLVPDDHPQRGLMGLPVADGALDSWLRTSPAAQPLRAICQAQCPGSIDACLRAAHGALGSHAAVLVMGSPVEGLIPEQLFLASPRGQSAVLRRILLTTDRRGHARMIETARATDACLAETLVAETHRYRYQRPETTPRQAEGD